MIQLNNSTLGISQNFANGISLAKGDYIAFADQDDIWLENKIEQLLNNIGSYPLVYSNSLLVDEAGNSLHKTLQDYKRMYTGTDSRCYVLYTCVWGHGMLITRSLAQQSLPIPAGIHHDVWIAFLAFKHGGIRYHDAALTLYRQHHSSHTNTIPQKTKARKRAERWKAYQQQLLWIELMRDNERPAYQPFYERLANLYRRKAAQTYVPALVWFMIRHRKALFGLSRKGVLSQLVEIAKQGRGERP